MAIDSKSAVAIFVYRKIESLKEIFDEVSRYNPPILYIFQNQSYNNDDLKNVQEVSHFLTNYEFTIPVKVIKQRKHLKINDHFYRSLNYAFSKEETLIILEDDTVPSHSFFTFCNYMLEKYNKDENIGCVNGSNLMAVDITNSYFCSSLSAPFWGWATWKSKWNLYKNNDYYWKHHSNQILSSLSDVNRNQVASIFYNTSSNSSLITWDVLWNWALMANHLKCIIPGQNLISNKGFNIKGLTTNYNNSNYSNLKKYSFSIEILEKIKHDGKEVILLEKKIIELYNEIRNNQKSRIYDNFSDHKKNNFYQFLLRKLKN